ncbi:MAG: reverse transcriptase domain-containing protein [Planctomycetaceae bacterium]
MPTTRRTNPDQLTHLQQQLFQTRRSEPQAQNLWTSLLRADNLRAAWDRVSENAGAETPGVDGVACRHLRGRVDAWLRELSLLLQHQHYEPDSVRLVEVPKSSGHGMRTLGILTIRDRVVQTALKQVLEPLLEPAFAPNSFGFRPGRSVAAALDAAVRPLNDSQRPNERRLRVAIQLDVADCFDSIDHRTLQAQLREHIADERVLALLDLILNHSGHEVGWWRWRRRVGLVQGSGLSPLLCNLALHPVDQILRQAATESSQRVLGLRYADDLLLLASDFSLARRNLRAVTRTLAQLRLSLRRDKLTEARIEDGIEWLGVRIQPRPSLVGRPARFGYQIPDAKILKMLAALQQLTEPPPRLTATPTACARRGTSVAAHNLDSNQLGPWLKSLNEQLRSWREAYVFADNAVPVFDLIDQQTQDRVRLVLQRIASGRGGLDQYRHKLPRGFWTWKAGGVQLVNLSSLAPRRPDHLVHKPQWMKPSQSRSD